MGRFDGVGDANYNDGGVYFEEGKYLVRVDKIKVQDNRKNIEQFFVETTILTSNNPKRKPGMQCAAMTQKSWDTYLGWIKHTMTMIVASKEGMDPEEIEIDNAGVEEAISDENPYEGTIMEVQATQVKTKTGGDFTKITWVVPTPEEIKKHAKAA